MHDLLREWIDLRGSASHRGNRKRRQLDTVQIPRLRTFGFALLVAMAALAPPGLPETVRALGAETFLDKPLDPAALYSTLGNISSAR